MELNVLQVMHRDSGGLEVIMLVVFLRPSFSASCSNFGAVSYFLTPTRILADASSVELTRKSQGMITALLKLENSQPTHHVDDASSALYITDPQNEVLKTILYSSAHFRAD